MEHNNSVEQMQQWQDDWSSVCNQFQKPQIIADAIDDASFFRNLHDAYDPKNDDVPINPVDTFSLGKDQDLESSDNFTDGDKLRELNSIKVSLHALEDKINTAAGLGKDENNLMKQVEAIRSKIDELSNKLNSTN